MGTMPSVSLCLARSPGLPGAQEIESSAAKDSGKQQILRKSKTQVKKSKKNPSFQQFATVLGCKPSPATGLGVGREMRHSKGLFSLKAISTSNASVLAQSFLGEQLGEAGGGAMLRSASRLEDW